MFPEVAPAAEVFFWVVSRVPAALSTCASSAVPGGQGGSRNSSTSRVGRRRRTSSGAECLLQLNLLEFTAFFFYIKTFKASSRCNIAITVLFILTGHVSSMAGYFALCHSLCVFTFSSLIRIISH